MTQALSREQVLFELWASRTRESHGSDLDALVLEELRRKGFVSGANGTAKLNDKGLDFVLNRRETQELVALLSDIEMQPEEREFLANAIKGIIDKPFAYQIIKESRDNPNRQNYPSVDLGAYVDVEHGVLFGARQHIMIDPLLNPKYLPEISGKLVALGAKVKGSSSRGSTTRISYIIGEEDRELYLVASEAMKVDASVKRAVERGISSLMMKGWEQYRHEFGDLKDALDHYNKFLLGEGLMLTRWPPKTGLQKIGEGMIEYHTHLDGMSRLALHGLFVKS